jgi:hypothetical protein
VIRVFRGLLILAMVWGSTVPRAASAAPCDDEARASAGALVEADCDGQPLATRRRYVACAVHAVRRSDATATCAPWVRRLARRSFCVLPDGTTCRRGRLATMAMPDRESAGRVLFTRAADSSFDAYTRSPSLTQQTWMRNHFWRMRTYTPYFDTRLSWYGNAWFYKDLYAIYVGESAAAQHPEWILRDTLGSPLYIPYACSGGRCPQYAGDIGSPTFRARWIEQARGVLARGYRGLFVDDVNMRLQVSDGYGNLVAPVDPRTGRPMSLADWRRYTAEFAEEIRAAFPGVEIVHNQVWFFAPWTDLSVLRAVFAADFIEFERGITDTGIRGGGGQFGFETFLTYIDVFQWLGKGVVLDQDAGWGREYALATYFLVSTGMDGFGSRLNATLADWWSGYDVDLGAAETGRYRWQGLFRRDFAGGIVLVNQPDQPTITVDLDRPYRGLDGVWRSTVSLDAASGVVLLGS